MIPGPSSGLNTVPSPGSIAVPSPSLIPRMDLDTAYLCLRMQYGPWTQTFLNVVDSIRCVRILVMIIVGVGIIDGKITAPSVTILVSSSLFSLMNVRVGS